MVPDPQTVFLLSPARCDGKRAQVLLGERAEFPLAVKLRGAGAPIGEVFSFLSGLYFRGKLAYSRAFARGTPGGVRVIAPGRGLIAPGRLVFPSDFVGRGDMSRGGLMLRCVLEQRELAYVPIAGAIQRGSRPPRLTPLRRRP